MINQQALPISTSLNQTRIFIVFGRKPALNQDKPAGFTNFPQGCVNMSHLIIKPGTYVHENLLIKQVVIDLKLLLTASLTNFMPTLNVFYNLCLNQHQPDTNKFQPDKKQAKPVQTLTSAWFKTGGRFNSPTC